MKLLSHIRHLDKRGITIIWLALFMLVLLIMFAGLAVDIGYMYYVKNELQVAADAAALAGAPLLSNGADDFTVNPSILDQLPARQQAWKFACKNKAAQESAANPSARVYLVTNSPANCDTPPSSATGLNGGNNVDGDIVVGNWSETERSCPSTGNSEKFCPANGSTGFLINAVRIVARRTGASAQPDVKIGDNPVRVFWGKIFSMIDTDWSLMSAQATAIARMAFGKKICSGRTGTVSRSTCAILEEVNRVKGDIRKIQPNLIRIIVRAIS